MLRPSSAPKFNELIGRLNALKGQPLGAWDLEIRRIKREAEMLKKSDPAGAFSTLGIVACIEGKIADMHQFHQNALTYSDDDPTYLLNYAAALRKADLLDDALKYAKMVYDKSQTNLEHRKDGLDVLIDVADMMGLEEEFFFYTEEWMKLTGKPHYLIALKEAEESVEEVSVLSVQYVPASELFRKVEDLIKDVRD